MARYLSIGDLVRERYRYRHLDVGTSEKVAPQLTFVLISKVIVYYHLVPALAVTCDDDTHNIINDIITLLAAVTYFFAISFRCSSEFRYPNLYADITVSELLLLYLLNTRVQL